MPDPQWYLDRYGQPHEVMEGTVNLERGQIRVRLLRYSTEGVQITVIRAAGTSKQNRWEVNGFSELSGPEDVFATAISATQFGERMKHRAARVLAESQGE